MLEVKNISSGYDKRQVLFDVSFTVGDGEIVLLQGGNASGKSTMLNVIYGILPNWNPKGEILFNGVNILKLKTSDLVKVGISYIPQKNNVFESLTVHENLRISGSSYSDSKNRIKKIYDIFPILEKNKNNTPFSLSGGERKILAFGLALMHNPKLILMDEPFAALDRNNTEIVKSELIRLKNNGVSILFTNHVNAKPLNTSDPKMKKLLDFSGYNSKNDIELNNLVDRSLMMSFGEII